MNPSNWIKLGQHDYFYKVLLNSNIQPSIYICLNGSIVDILLYKYWLISSDKSSECLYNLLTGWALIRQHNFRHNIQRVRHSDEKIYKLNKKCITSTRSRINTLKIFANLKLGISILIDSTRFKILVQNKSLILCTDIQIYNCMP